MKISPQGLWTLSTRRISPQGFETLSTRKISPQGFGTLWDFIQGFENDLIWRFVNFIQKITSIFILDKIYKFFKSCTLNWRVTRS
jgi:hypothetical protein